MTVLSVCQQAAKLMGQAAPTSMYGATDKFAVELSVIANAVGEYVMKQHDWRLLHTLHTLSGDATTTAFSFATDYDRMPVKAALFLVSTSRQMRHVLDLDEWEYNRLRSLNNPEGEWMILGGNLNIYPAMGASDSAKYYYISKNYATNTGGTAQASFTADTDNFRFKDSLLKYGVIWRWRAMKGLDYAEDMQNFEIALSQEIKNDKGSHILRIGRSRLPDGVSWAYPGVINA